MATYFGGMNWELQTFSGTASANTTYHIFTCPDDSTAFVTSVSIRANSGSVSSLDFDVANSHNGSTALNPTFSIRDMYSATTSATYFNADQTNGNMLYHNPLIGMQYMMSGSSVSLGGAGGGSNIQMEDVSGLPIIAGGQFVYIRHGNTGASCLYEVQIAVMK